MIAKGYNPLIDRNSIFFQTIATNKIVNVNPIGNFKKKDSRFLSKKKYTVYQLGEIQNKIIQNFMKEYWEENRLLVQFDYETGWFTKEAYRNLKKLIQIKLN